MLNGYTTPKTHYITLVSYLLSLIPGLQLTEVLLRPGGELQLEGESESRVYVVQEL